MHCYFSSFFECVEEPAIADPLIFVILEIPDDGAAQEVVTGKVSLFSCSFDLHDRISKRL